MRPTTAVVTIAHGRHRHLRRQHESLVAGRTAPGPRTWSWPWTTRSWRRSAARRRPPSPTSSASRATPVAFRWPRPATSASRTAGRGRRRRRGRARRGLPGRARRSSRRTATPSCAQPERRVERARSPTCRRLGRRLPTGPARRALDDPHSRAAGTRGRAERLLGGGSRPVLVAVVRRCHARRVGARSAASARTTSATAARTPTSPSSSVARRARRSAGSATPGPTTSTTRLEAPPWSISTTSCATARSSPGAGDGGRWTGWLTEMERMGLVRPDAGLGSGWGDDADARAATWPPARSWSPPCRPATSTSDTCAAADETRVTPTARPRSRRPTPLRTGGLVAAGHARPGVDRRGGVRRLPPPVRVRRLGRRAAARGGGRPAARGASRSSTPCTTSATPTTRTGRCTTLSSTCWCPRRTRW